MSHHSRNPARDRRIEAYLDSFVDYEKMQGEAFRMDAFDLAHVNALLSAVDRGGCPFPIIHVGGTKGKGSVCLMLQQLLRMHGLKSALFTSPHLAGVEERIQIDGASVSSEAMWHAVEHVMPVIDALESRPSYFEVLTAVAYQVFLSHKVDVAVFEVGMGGRLDATNCLSTALTILTPVELDHTRQLGSVLEAIAMEKAGIIHAGTPVVVAPQQDAAHAIFVEKAREVSAPFHDVRDACHWRTRRQDVSGTGFAVTTPAHAYQDLFMPVCGAHQVQNAATALMAVEIFSQRGFLSVDEDKVRSSLARVNLPGRVEILDKDPLRILDGCHTVGSAEALADALRALDVRDGVLIFGIAGDKQAARILDRLLDPFAQVIFTKTGNPRAVDPCDLKRMLPTTRGLGVFTEDNPVSAWQLGTEVLGKDRAVVCAGSLHLAGEIRKGLFASRGGM